jgi:hypothetical protein
MGPRCSMRPAAPLVGPPPVVPVQTESSQLKRLTIQLAPRHSPSWPAPRVESPSRRCAPTTARAPASTANGQRHEHLEQPLLVGHPDDCACRTRPRPPDSHNTTTWRNMNDDVRWIDCDLELLPDHLAGARLLSWTAWDGFRVARPVLGRVLQLHGESERVMPVVRVCNFLAGFADSPPPLTWMREPDAPFVVTSHGEQSNRAVRALVQTWVRRGRAPSIGRCQVTRATSPAESSCGAFASPSGSTRQGTSPARWSRPRGP